MGIRTDPGYTLIGVRCAFYFGAGNTPKKVYASFTGIVPGGAPRTDFTAGPNIVVALEQISACKWEKIIGTVTFTFQVLAASMQLTQKSSIDDNRFIGTIVGFPQFSWANGLAAGAPWTSGNCTVTTRAPWSNPPASIQGVMDLLNIEPHRSTMAEFFPVGLTHITHRIARRRDKSRLFIKIDPALF